MSSWLYTGTRQQDFGGKVNEIWMTKHQYYGERSARLQVSVWQMVLGVPKSEKASVKKLQMVT